MPFFDFLLCFFSVLRGTLETFCSTFVVGRFIAFTSSENSSLCFYTVQAEIFQVEFIATAVAQNCIKVFYDFRRKQLHRKQRISRWRPLSLVTISSSTAINFQCDRERRSLYFLYLHFSLWRTANLPFSRISCSFFVI